MNEIKVKQSPVATLKDLGITEPGTYNLPCVFHESSEGKKQLSITVNYGENMPQREEFLGGLYNCFSCPAKGRVFNGELYPARGVKTDGVFKKNNLNIPPLGDIPDLYSQTFGRVWQIYKTCYMNSPGYDYMKKRGFDADKVGQIAGFSPLGSKTLLRSKIDQELLLSLALIDDKGRDRFSGRVVMPLTWNGRVTGLYGRSVLDNPKMKHLYTKTSIGSDRWRRGVFGEKALGQKRLVLTEAVLDSLALRSMGVQHVCALGGVYNTIAIDKVALDAKIIVALDNDTTGNSVSDKLLEHFGSRALRITPPPLPNGVVVKDWSAYLQQWRNDFPHDNPSLPMILQKKTIKSNVLGIG